MEEKGSSKALFLILVFFCLFWGRRFGFVWKSSSVSSKQFICLEASLCLGILFTKMDGPHGKDLAMAGGREERLEQHGADRGSREANGGNMDHGAQRRIKQRADYLKEATVVLDLKGNKEVKAMDIIKVVSEKIGFGKLLAVRPKYGEEYELTVEGAELCDVLLDGMEIKGQFFEIRRLEVKEHMVSFLHLPAYLEDEVIENKLKFWGVNPMTKIKRRVYPGTNIADGTRYVKVKFPKEVTSLPYSAKFETADGAQYFRVIHDGQEKLCRMCMQPGHIFRDCPDFKCFECFEQGHFAKDCKADKCLDCGKVFMRCDCESEHEEEINDETENGEPEENMESMDIVINEGEEDGSLNDSKSQEQEKGRDKELERGKGVEMVEHMIEGCRGREGDIIKERQENKKEKEQVEECIEVNLEELRRGMKRGILDVKSYVGESREKGQRRRRKSSTNDDGVLIEKVGEKYEI